jgi:hypothetical protein
LNCEAASHAADHSGLGIYVGIMLFDGFSSVHEADPSPNLHANPWSGHPYNVENNINGIDADANRDAHHG